MPSDAALENLARIGQLDKVPFSSELMARMLATARSRLIDAQRRGKTLGSGLSFAHATTGHRAGRWWRSIPP